MSDFIDPNPDCLSCSFLSGRKYKLCDDCFNAVVRRYARGMPGMLGAVVALAVDSYDGGPDIVKPQEHERRREG